MVAETLNLRVPAEATAIAPVRHEVVGYAEQLGAGEAVRDAVRLAVSEALTNVVMHAYPGRQPGDMIVEVWLDEDHLALLVCDEGMGLLPATRMQSPGLGLGFGLMAQMADDFTVANREDQPGTIVAMRFSLAGGGCEGAALCVGR